MRFNIFLEILLLLLIAEASALTISYNISPEIVLPNGYADCVITLRNTESKAIEINSIAFYSKTIKFEPASIQSIGNLSSQGVYTLKVSMTSSVVGRQNADLIVSTSEGTFSQTMELLVDDRFPEISLSSPLNRGEVNYAKLLISSPVELRNVQVEALFNAVPKTFFISSLSGVTELQFRLSEELDYLNFKISFYNGRSYHTIEKGVKVDYMPSKGLTANLNPSKDVLYIGEAVNLTLEISNLRNDEVYSVEVQLSGNGKFSQSVARVDKILAGEKKTLNFIFSPRESGSAQISAKIAYKDFFGNSHEKYENLTLSVLDSYVLQIVNLKMPQSMGKTKISGEVINYGHRSALNTKVSAFCDEAKADYYVGEIDANDYETFDLEISCSEATLTLTWWNDAGDSFSISEKLEGNRVDEQREKSSLPLYIGTIASIIVLAFVAYVAYRARKK